MSLCSRLRSQMPQKRLAVFARPTKILALSLLRSILATRGRLRQSPHGCYNRGFPGFRALSRMPRWNRVSIIGVGLIGGSIGLSLQKRGLASAVVGYGRRAESLHIAEKMGAIQQGFTSLEEACRDADFVVACAPVDWIPEHLREASKHCAKNALLTDVGSTKCEIVQSLRDLPGDVRFVAAHPLAGSEKSGPQHAEETLFENRTVVITPTESTDTTAIEEVMEFWTALGSNVLQRTPQDHDRALAATSHLPHVIASVLAAATNLDDLPLTATGWKDTTRIASGEVELWRQILTDNRENVATALRHFESYLARFRSALENEVEDELVELLKQGKDHRDALGS